MMSQPTEPALSLPDCAPAALLRVFAAARRFLAYRARAAALASHTGAGVQPSLAEAIERDFLAFDISRAECELREAVLAVIPEAAPEDRRQAEDTVLDRQ